jgi:RNA polymerase subunit RPABC4/transcription elongation factor Spt4
VLCNNCNATLIEGSHFCPHCGKPRNGPPENTALVVATPPSACRKCGTSLPEGSEFCLKCGQRIIPEAVAVAPPLVPAAKSGPLAPVVFPAPPVRPARARRKLRHRPSVWLLIILLLACAWIAIGNDPIAQQYRDDITGARTQTIVETPFSIKPLNFSYFEFTVPPGAVNVTVTGQFTTESLTLKRNGKASAKDGNKNQGVEDDNNIETYLLTDAAFVVWRKGYSTGSHHESGRVAQGSINATLPAGAGIYYFVFNNKFSPRAEKTIHANVLLHYQTWVPQWLLRMKERLWNWLGLN